MNIEIRGAGFGNKGAELMLCAIVQELQSRMPGSRCCVVQGVGSPEERARYGLLQKMRIRRGQWLRDMIQGRGYRERNGLVREADVDVVLDASGFAYGDAWKAEWIERSATELERYQRDGKKVVLLPQAFGPFKDERVRAAATRVARAADSIFARDCESLKAVQNLVPDHLDVALYPDFTSCVPGSLPEAFEVLDRRVCVIPNTQMLHYGSEASREAYIPLLVRCADQVASRGFLPSFLVHGADDDRVIAEDLKAQCSAAVELIEEADPVRLKGIIGSCAFVVGSRFHALVSALSQGVPALGTSWSHKYKYLFEDYGCSEMLLDVTARAGVVTEKLDALSDEGQRAVYSRNLADKGAALKEKTEEMWREVEGSLKGQTGPSHSD